MTVVYMWITLWIRWILLKKVHEKRHLYLVEAASIICKLNCRVPGWSIKICACWNHIGNNMRIYINGQKG